MEQLIAFVIEVVKILGTVSILLGVLVFIIGVLLNAVRKAFFDLIMRRRGGGLNGDSGETNKYTRRSED